MKNCVCSISAAALAMWCCSRIVAAEPAAHSIKFNRDIRPILSENCFACHGPDEKQRKGKLRLDTKEGLYSKRDDYFIVAPGKSTESELYRRITATDEDDHMPPVKTGKKLAAAQVETIRRWIDAGAEWQGHWAFIPPERPTVPEVKAKAWPKNEIDHFILSKLESVGLAPSREADKTKLIRRASFDLTGLPPTLEEVDAFLADQSSEAYDKLVDRLLASPRYGERMALHWLDLARYADTHGYHLDSGRDMWKWREWVIDAFNRNQPFDQFTTEQIAGDLLPNATISQKLATGFNRNSMINFEGGAIPEEYLTQYIIDRVSTTSTVFLGLTMACAQCHDHKFDPLTQKDFYQFYAYFNAVPENGLDGREGNAAPLLFLPTGEQESRLQAMETAIQAADTRLKEALPEIDAAQRQWEKDLTARLKIDWQILDFTRATSAGGATLTKLDDGSILASGANPDQDVYGLVARTERTNITAIRLEALTDSTLPGNGPGRSENSNFVLTEFQLETAPRSDEPQFSKVKFARGTADYSQRDFEIGKAIDGNATTGWAVDGDTRHQSAVATFVCEAPLGHAGGTVLKFRLSFSEAHKRHSIGRVRLALTSDPAAAEKNLPPIDIQKALLLAAGDRTDKQTAALQKYYRESVSPIYKQRNDELMRVRKAFNDFRKTIPTSMVMSQMEKPRDTFILMRGQYNKPGEKVSPGVPAALGTLRAGAPANRLGLAEWLVDPRNPLVARVTVNRFWGMVMGTGFVKTANDFGSRAEWPTHPELLDWLATEFIRSGWDVKYMMKLLVTSATYRQSTAVSPELAEKDPDNRLYARGPRFRLQAEAIRDNALAISGLLTPTMGGPSVSPYQPPGLWEELSSRKDSKNWSAQFFVQSHGRDLYRRSMYTFWKRTSPPPSLQAFDAPDRETCVVQRDRTTTPLQALVLMNDPTYVEAARKLAERIMAQAETGSSDRIVFAFRLATARQPNDAEMKLLSGLFETQLRRFRAHTDEARKLLEVGESPRDEQFDVAELAAWTTIASMILNLDETITKG